MSHLLRHFLFIYYWVDYEIVALQISNLSICRNCLAGPNFSEIYEDSDCKSLGRKRIKVNLWESNAPLCHRMNEWKVEAEGQNFASSTDYVVIAVSVDIVGWIQSTLSSSKRENQSTNQINLKLLSLFLSNYLSTFLSGICHCRRMKWVSIRSVEVAFHPLMFLLFRWKHLLLRLSRTVTYVTSTLVALVDWRRWWFLLCHAVREKSRQGQGDGDIVPQITLGTLFLICALREPLSMSEVIVMVRLTVQIPELHNFLLVHWH